MKVINTGNEFSVYDDSLQTYDRLPAQTYVVRFSKRRGFYMEKHSDMEISEEKVYGIHTAKVDKVLKSFSVFERNLGVILSGAKGIGKSLFAKMLAMEAVSRGIPVIIVDEYMQGIGSYIESIEQEAVVLFDEFDKTFCDKNNDDSSNQPSPQASLLSLFDGLAGGKKLFVITCNDLNALNDYIVNRPGRFHYHFRFDYPNAEEIREYLRDKLSEQYYGEIDNVVVFARKIDLNYDCLRAIAFEINNGIPFKEAIGDLNIINSDDIIRYDISLMFANGREMVAHRVPVDMFDNEQKFVWLDDGDDYQSVSITFIPRDAVYDVNKFCFTVSGDRVHIDYGSTDEDTEKAMRETSVDCLVLRRVRDKGIRYMV